MRKSRQAEEKTAGTGMLQEDAKAGQHFRPGKPPRRGLKERWWLPVQLNGNMLSFYLLPENEMSLILPKISAEKGPCRCPALRLLFGGWEVCPSGRMRSPVRFCARCAAPFFFPDRLDGFYMSILCRMALLDFPRKSVKKSCCFFALHEGGSPACPGGVV